MAHHLGYDKNQPKSGSNTRNGYSTKMIMTGDGPLKLRAYTGEDERLFRGNVRVIS